MLLKACILAMAKNQTSNNEKLERDNQHNHDIEAPEKSSFLHAMEPMLAIE
jgi:hypothetical protein